MDPMPIVSMLFTLVLAAMVGGFILLFPISRRLGAYLEQRLEGRLGGDGSAAERRELESAVRSLQREIERLSERQAFTEALLSDRDPLLLPEESETGGR
jgi:hypothetical protein